MNEGAIPRFGLMVIGDEILSGKRADGHFPKVVELFAARGLTLSWVLYLGDERAAIVDALKRSLASADVVFSTGGIGATPDDHTRQAAAAALGVDLVLHPEAERLIAGRIREMNSGELSSDENRQRMRMGEFPAGAEIIPNPYNRIPGFSLRDHHFVPGFPVMAWPMLEWVLDTRYAHLFHQAPQSERSMLVFHTAESTLTPLMESVEAAFPSARVFSLPSVGEPDAGEAAGRAQRHVELGVKGPREIVPLAYAMMRDGVLALDAPFQEFSPLNH